MVDGGGGGMRTTEACAADLQSDPFGHSGTPPTRSPKGLFPGSLTQVRHFMGIGMLVQSFHTDFLYVSNLADRQIIQAIQRYRPGQNLAV